MRWVVPLVGAILVLAAVLALLRYTATDSGAGPLVVEVVQGDVRRGRDGEEVHAQLGMHLRAGDRVTTGPEGRATLSRGGRSTLRLSEGTTVELSAIDEGVIEVELSSGRVRARVRPDGGALRVSRGDRSVLGTSATFDAAVDDQGVFTVEASEGQLAVSGLADVARLEPGSRLVAFPDGSSALEPIPTELLLQVDWPTATPIERVSVVGRTAAGARVRLVAAAGSAQGQADARGRFALELDLVPGDNQVEVVVTDAMGREHRQAGTLVRQAGRKPTVRVDVEYEGR